MAATRPTEEQIRARAYQLFVGRGSLPGHEIDDWCQAEYELMQLPVEAIAKLASNSPKTGKRRQSALVSLVQTALLIGAGTLPYLK